MDDERVDAWLDSLDPVLERLAWFTPAGFPHDFSAASLDVLEQVLARQVPPVTGAEADLMSGRATTRAAVQGTTRDATRGAVTDTGLVDSAVAYLGEALLRVGGGRWDWDVDPDSATFDLPLLRFDDALDLPPLAPLRLMIEARRAGTGSVLRDAHERLSAQVAGHQRTHPGWSPVKEHSFGVDEIDPSERPRHPWLTAWLEQREAGFPAWAQQCAQAGPWDFSPGSIDRLARLTLDRFATVEQFGAAGGREFVDGAVWYLGESVRRGADGVTWLYDPVPPGYPDAAAYYAQTGDGWVDVPYLAKYPGEHRASPRALLKVAVLRREADLPRTGVAGFW